MSTLDSGWKRRFAAFWSAQASSLFGSSLIQFALVWWLTEKTGSATVLAMSSMVAMLPQVIIGPFAGVLVDRWNRRQILIVSDLVAAGAAGVLALLFMAGTTQVWHIYLALFVRSVANAFQFPAQQSSTTLLVPDAQLSRVAGFNQMLQGLMSVAAPPLGALLLKALPMQGIMVIDILTAIVAVLLVGAIHIPQPERPVTESLHEVETSLRQEMMEGIRVFWQWRGLRILLFSAVALNLLLTPAFSLMPILVTKTFKGDAVLLAMIEAALGLGMVGGGMLLGVWGGFKRRIVTTLVGVTGLGLSTLLVGLTPGTLPLMAVGAMALLGLTLPITNGPIMAMIQSIVPPAVQGRAFTVMNSLTIAATPLGLILAGPLADRFGVPLWFIIGGIACLALAAMMALSPAVMTLEQHKATLSPQESPVSSPEVAGAG